jgi:hypothetical protein
MLEYGTGTAIAGRSSGGQSPDTDALETSSVTDTTHHTVQTSLGIEFEDIHKSDRDNAHMQAQKQDKLYCNMALSFRSPFRSPTAFYPSDWCTAAREPSLPSMAYSEAKRS